MRIGVRVSLPFGNVIFVYASNFKRPLDKLRDHLHELVEACRDSSGINKRIFAIYSSLAKYMVTLPVAFSNDERLVSENLFDFQGKRLA